MQNAGSRSEYQHDVLAMCFKHPTEAPAIAKSMKKSLILKHSCHLLPPIPRKVSWAKYVAIVAKATSRLVLAIGLGFGQGTRGLQTLLNVLSHRIYKYSSCPSCGTSLRRLVVVWSHILVWLTIYYVKKSFPF